MRISAALLVLSSIGASTLTGCIPEFDDDLARVNTRRVLAVKSVPAEAKPGETVTLTALVAEPDSNASPTELSWSLCLERKPLTELGPVAQDCIERFGETSEIFEPLGRGDQVSATLPDDVCRQFGPLTPPPKKGEEGGRPVDPDLSGGYYQPVIVGDGEANLGSIRVSCGAVGLSLAEGIVFTRGYRPNENPELTEVTLRGQDDEVTLPDDDSDVQQVRAGETFTIEAAFPACPTKAECGDGICSAGENQVDCAADCRDNPKGCAGAERYLFADVEDAKTVEYTESVLVGWFSNAGRFDGEQTEAKLDDDTPRAQNTWTAPEKTGPVKLWLVARDDRGGVGWRSFSLEVVD